MVENKWFHAFPKGIYSKVNIVTLRYFEFTYLKPQSILEAITSSWLLQPIAIMPSVSLSLSLSHTLSLSLTRTVIYIYIYFCVCVCERVYVSEGMCTQRMHADMSQHIYKIHCRTRVFIVCILDVTFLFSFSFFFFFLTNTCNKDVSVFLYMCLLYIYISILLRDWFYFIIFFLFIFFHMHMCVSLFWTSGHLTNAIKLRWGSYRFSSGANSCCSVKTTILNNVFQDPSHVYN